MYRRNNLAYRIVDSFFRHRLVFLTAVLCTTALTAIVLTTKSKGFVATGWMQIHATDPISKSLGDQVSPWSNPAQEATDHFYSLMRDDLPGGFIDSFLKAAKLAKPIDLDPRADDPRLAALRKNLSAFAENRDTMGVQLKWDNAAECERIVRAAQLQYVNDVGNTEEAEQIKVEAFLNDQITRVKKEMRVAEGALTDYKSRHQGALPAAQQAQVEQLSQMQTEYKYLQVTIKDNALKKQKIQEQLSQMQPTSLKEATLAESPTAAKIKQLQAERNDKLAQDYLPSSQVVMDLNDKIRKLTWVANQEANELLNKKLGSGQYKDTKIQANEEYLQREQDLADADIAQQTQTARMNLLADSIRQAQAEVAALPAAERMLTEKTRNYDVLTKQYDQLEAQREDAALKADIKRIAATAKMRSLGRVVADPITGKSKQLIMLALSVILGLVAGVMVVIAREWLDPTLRYENDVERALDVPVLAGLIDSNEILGLPEPEGGSPRRPTRPSLPTPTA